MRKQIPRLMSWVMEMFDVNSVHNATWCRFDWLIGALLFLDTC